MLAQLSSLTQTFDESATVGISNSEYLFEQLDLNFNCLEI